MSSRSLSVSAGAEMPPPWRLTPLRLDSSPPERTVVAMRVPDDLLDLEHDLAVRQQQRVAGVTSFGQILVGDSRLRLIGAGVRIERGIERERRALGQHRPAVAKALDADLRPGEVGQNADVAVGLARRLAHHLDAPALRIARAVREIDARHIETGAAPCRRPRRVVGRGSERRDDLGSSLRVHSPHASAQSACLRRRVARCSSIATAGSVLPSTNSRNAPPPVEM